MIILITALSGVLANCSPVHVPGALNPENLGGRTPLAINGKDVYQTNCAACHGPLESSSKLGRNSAQIAGAIGSVPAMAGLNFLTVEEIDAVADALTPPLDGKALYGAHCAMCHGALASSTKVGRNSTQITTAIGSIPAMAGLKSLTAEEIEAIAKALLPPPIDGAQLYANKCAACHGALAVSTKLGRSASQITGAINSIPMMSSLKTLTTLEVDAIAQALSLSTLPAPTTEADRYFYSNDLPLYTLGRKYFPADETAPAKKRIFRLTRTQLDQAVKTLLPTYSFKSISETMAKDALQTNYEYADIININAANFTPLTDWIATIAETVRANPQGAISCPNGDATCLRNQSRALISKAFRGDVEEAEIAKLVTFFTDQVTKVGLSTATGDLVDVVLNSPHFLYRQEFDTDATGTIAQAELLSGISFTLADGPPETLNFSSNQPAPYVDTPAAIKATIQTALAHPETRKKLARFIHRWLEVKEPGEFTISTVVYPNFKGPLVDAILLETDTFLNQVLAGPNPTLKSITQATYSFITKPMAELYDLDPAQVVDGAKIPLDPNRRMGVFSQPAVIASHSGPSTARPMKRGVFWVRKVMCMDMEPPPPGVDTTIPDTLTGSERQKIETLTSQASCTGCHSKINPLGFFQSHFDTVGKWRTTDDGFAVDSSLVTSLLDEGPISTKTPVEALNALTSSAMFKQCFVRQMFRFFMGRNEEPSDHPILREMFYHFAHKDGQDVLKPLTALGNSSRFKIRSEP